MGLWALRANSHSDFNIYILGETISVGVVDTFVVDRTIGVAEGAEGAITSDVQREAVAFHVREFFNHMAWISIETFGTDIFVTATDQNQVLFVQEFAAIDDWVERLAAVSCIPIVLNDGTR